MRHVSKATGLRVRVEELLARNTQGGLWHCDEVLWTLVKEYASGKDNMVCKFCRYPRCAGWVFSSSVIANCCEGLR